MCTQVCQGQREILFISSGRVFLCPAAQQSGHTGWPLSPRILLSPPPHHKECKHVPPCSVFHVGARTGLQVFSPASLQPQQGTFLRTCHLQDVGSQGDRKGEQVCRAIGGEQSIQTFPSIPRAIDINIIPMKTDIHIHHTNTPCPTLGRHPASPAAA